MSQAAVVYTNIPDSTTAGSTLGWQIGEKLKSPPEVVILFVSPVYDPAELLQAVQRTCRPKLMLGCSSSGEFTSEFQGVGLACAVALSSDEMQFSLGVAHNLSKDPRRAAEEAVSAFQGIVKPERESRFSKYEDASEQGKEAPKFRYRSAIILLDTLGATVESFLEYLTACTHGNYQFFGGGAGDNFQFCNTTVFFETEVLADAAVVLEILSNKPLGIGALHSWVPVTGPMLVTETSGRDLISVDDRPALEIFREHASRSGQLFDVNNPRPFLLHNAIGVDTTAGYRMRTPLKINPDGSIRCATEIANHALICLMNSTAASTIDATEWATRSALQRLYGSRPAVTLFFDCPSSRVRLGEAFASELQAIQKVIKTASYIGYNSYGQIARTEGQYYGFMNCTPTVCIIPA